MNQTAATAASDLLPGLPQSPDDTLGTFFGLCTTRLPKRPAPHLGGRWMGHVHVGAASITSSRRSSANFLACFAASERGRACACTVQSRCPPSPSAAYCVIDDDPQAPHLSHLASEAIARPAGTPSTILSPHNPQAQTSSHVLYLNAPPHACSSTLVNDNDVRVKVKRPRRG